MNKVFEEFKTNVTYRLQERHGENSNNLSSFCKWITIHDLGDIVRRQILLRDPKERKLWRVVILGI